MLGTKHQIFESILKLFGYIYIEQNIPEDSDKIDEFNKAVQESIQEQIKHIQMHYEAAMKDEDLRKEPIVNTLGKMFEKKDNAVEEAKRLLESKGYRIGK